MNTVTIQIGNSDDKLTQGEWNKYVRDVQKAIESYSYDQHFFGGSPNWFPWQNVAWCIVVPDSELDYLKQAIRDIREYYKQDSVAFTVGETEFI